MPPDADEEDERPIHFVEASAPTPPPSGTDVIPARRRLGLPDRIVPRVWFIGAVAAALAIGLGTGYAIGRHNAPTHAVRGATTPSSSSAAFGPTEALALTGVRCSVQHGRQLELGIEVINNSSAAVTLVRTISHQPRGGLQPIRSIRGTCNQLAPATGGEIDGYHVRPGATVWLTLAFQVLVQCPQPLPVQIDVDYLRDGSPHHVDLGGFPDLGSVPYSGCPS